MLKETIFFVGGWGIKQLFIFIQYNNNTILLDQNNNNNNTILHPTSVNV